MKKKNKKLIWIILILIITLGVMVYSYFNPKENSNNSDSNNMREISAGIGNIERTISGTRRDFIKR